MRGLALLVALLLLPATAQALSYYKVEFGDPSYGGWFRASDLNGDNQLTGEEVLGRLFWGNFPYAANMFESVTSRNIKSFDFDIESRTGSISVIFSMTCRAGNPGDYYLVPCDWVYPFSAVGDDVAINSWTYVTPLPGSGVLFGTVLLGVGAARVRRRRTGG